MQWGHLGQLLSGREGGRPGRGVWRLASARGLCHRRWGCVAHTRRSCVLPPAAEPHALCARLLQRPRRGGRGTLRDAVFPPASHPPAFWFLWVWVWAGLDPAVLPCCSRCIHGGFLLRDSPRSRLGFRRQRLPQAPCPQHPAWAQATQPPTQPWSFLQERAEVPGVRVSAGRILSAPAVCCTVGVYVIGSYLTVCVSATSCIVVTFCPVGTLCAVVILDVLVTWYFVVTFHTVVPYCYLVCCGTFCPVLTFYVWNRHQDYRSQNTHPLTRFLKRKLSGVLCSFSMFSQPLTSRGSWGGQTPLFPVRFQGGTAAWLHLGPGLGSQRRTCSSARSLWQVPFSRGWAGRLCFWGEPTSPLCERWQTAPDLPQIGCPC